MKYILIDSQRLTTLQTCPQKFEYKFEKNLASLTIPEPLEVGGIIHKTLSCYYGVMKYRDRWLGVYGRNKLIETCMKVARYFTIKSHIEIGKADNLLKTLEDYFNYYENDPMLINNILGVEQYFAVPSQVIDNEYQIIIEGRIDLILVDQHTNNLIIVDHKSESSRRAFSMLRNQFLLYPWAIKSNNLIVNVIGLQLTKPSNEKFYRSNFNYPQNIIDEFEEDLVRMVKSYLTYMKENKFPRYRSSCDIYGVCEFERICKVSNHLREHIINTEFIEKRWDVFNT